MDHHPDAQAARQAARKAGVEGLWLWYSLAPAGAGRGAPIGIMREPSPPELLTVGSVRVPDNGFTRGVNSAQRFIDRVRDAIPDLIPGPL